MATAAGALHSQQLYKAWGESRYTSGTLPTRYTYTGQYSYASDFGLVFYGSRFYDPLLSRWASPDSIIPQNQGTQAWDRYSYVNNSPVNYTDPTGHDLEQIIFNKTGALPKSSQSSFVPHQTLTAPRVPTHNAIRTNDSLLDKPGINYGQAAESEYTGFSTSGASPQTGWTDLPGLLGWGFDWIHRNTELRRYWPFYNGTVSGEIYLDSTNSGIVFTGASIRNDDSVDMRIQIVTAQSTMSGSGGEGTAAMLYNYNPSTYCSYAGFASPGTTSSPVLISNYPIYPGQTVSFNIYVISNNGWYANIGTSVTVP